MREKNDKHLTMTNVTFEGADKLRALPFTSIHINNASFICIMFLKRLLSSIIQLSLILSWLAVVLFSATLITATSDYEKLMMIVKRDLESDNYLQLKQSINTTTLNISDSMTQNVTVLTKEFFTPGTGTPSSSSENVVKEGVSQSDLDENIIDELTTALSLNINVSNSSESQDLFQISNDNKAVDCNEFSEQKLMSIVICSTSDYINNVSNNLNTSELFNFTNALFSDDFNTTQPFDNPINDTSQINNEIDSTAYLVQVIVTSVVLGIIILATVIGNVFVIAAILLEKNLQSVANYLILSLAVADLLVACLVMPLSAVYEISREWKLGPELCDMWTSSDVLCCTASILHLVAIALDRYWAVTNIDYAHQRTGQRIGVMIVILWILSFFVSIAPMLGWKDPGWNTRLENYECLVSQDIGYQIFATASSFYVPLLAILFLYWRIYLVARKRIRRRQQVSYGQQQQQQQKKQMPPSISGSCIAQISGVTIQTAVAVIGKPLPTISEATTTTTTTAFTNLSSTNASPEKCSFDNEQSVALNSTASCPPTFSSETSKYKFKQSGPKVQKSKLKPSILKRKNQGSNDSGSKRERKAAKTLAIITGAFVVCWMPFFVIAVLLPFCASECGISPIIISFFLWLGYFNSTLNPILYTIFNQDFRHAFMKILCGRNRRKSRRMGMNLKD